MEVPKKNQRGTSRKSGQAVKAKKTFHSLPQQNGEGVSGFFGDPLIFYVI